MPHETSETIRAKREWSKLLNAKAAVKCYPCTRTILLPMYLDYTIGGSNKALQLMAR
jgi:hypothetical protein